MNINKNIYVMVCYETFNLFYTISLTNLMLNYFCFPFFRKVGISNTNNYLQHYGSWEHFIKILKEVWVMINFIRTFEEVCVMNNFINNFKEGLSVVLSSIPYSCTSEIRIIWMINDEFTHLNWPLSFCFIKDKRWYPHFPKI